MARIHGCVMVLLIVLVSLATCATLSQKEDIILTWEDYDGTDKDFQESPELYDQCKEQKVCAKTKNYPSDLVKWILEKLKTERNLIRFTNEAKHTDFHDVSHTLCDSTERILHPKAAVATDNEKWYFILNLNVNEIQRDHDGVAQFFQGFYVNICSKPKESCGSQYLIFDGTIETTSCEQKYASKQMVYLDLDKKFVSVRSFQVPTCCSCKMYKTIE